MSNLVTTVFRVKANKKALNQLSSINKSITNAESFAEVLGEDMDTGAKWANFVHVDNDTVSLESGNHLPDIAIKNLLMQRNVNITKRIVNIIMKMNATMLYVLDAVEKDIMRIRVMLQNTLKDII